jgi:hypothetical protein
VGGSALLQLVGDEVGVVEDHAEQIVEVVGHAARELTEALQATRLGHLRLPIGPGELLVPAPLNRLRLAQVMDHRDRGGALPRPERRDRHVEGELGAVGAQSVELQPAAEGAGRRHLEVALALGEVLIAVSRRDEHLDRPAQELVAAKAEDPLGLPVDEHDRTVPRHRHDGVRNRFEQVLGQPVPEQADAGLTMAVPCRDAGLRLPSRHKPPTYRSHRDTCPSVSPRRR